MCWVWCASVISASGRLKQEFKANLSYNHEFQTSLGYTVRPCIKKNRKEGKKQKEAMKEGKKEGRERGKEREKGQRT
jgi:hypothetical protein